MASRRYSIVIADRTSGVIRRFTLPLGPTVTTIVAALTLPILIGLGARWSALATLDELTTTNASLTVENDSYREATGQLVVADCRAADGRRRDRRHGRRRSGGEPRDGAAAGGRQVAGDGRRVAERRARQCASAQATPRSA